MIIKTINQQKSEDTEEERNLEGINKEKEGGTWGREEKRRERERKSPVTPAGGMINLPSSPYRENNWESSWAVVFAGKFLTKITVLDLCTPGLVKASSAIPLSSRNLRIEKSQ